MMLLCSYIVTKGMAMPTTMQLVNKHTTSLKQRVMYDIVRLMRNNGITIAELTTYEAGHTETVNVLQQLRKSMRLDNLAKQAKNEAVIKATVNSVYVRSGAAAAAEYLLRVGVTEANANLYVDNSTRLANIVHEMTTRSNPVSDTDSPAIIKSRIVSGLLASEETTEPEPEPPAPTVKKTRSTKTIEPPADTTGE